jgi:PIN domain nuclease of toxin-antitoxin system
VKLLLDTHALLWWLADDAQLGQQARALIAAPDNDVLVSKVSLWEIVVKLRVGKLSADLAGITDAVQRGGFTMLDIAIPHLRALAGLPMHHRDPFDHLLIAQAMTEGAALVTEDRHIPLYTVQTVPCADADRPA